MDQTVDTLEEILCQMVGALAYGREITAEDYRAVMAGIVSIANALKPLQLRKRRPLD